MAKQATEQKMVDHDYGMNSAEKTCIDFLIAGKMFKKNDFNPSKFFSISYSSISHLCLHLPKAKTMLE